MYWPCNQCMQEPGSLWQSHMMLACSGQWEWNMLGRSSSPDVVQILCSHADCRHSAKSWSLHSCSLDHHYYIKFTHHRDFHQRFWNNQWWYVSPPGHGLRDLFWSDNRRWRVFSPPAQCTIQRWSIWRPFDPTSDFWEEFRGPKPSRPARPPGPTGQVGSSLSSQPPNSQVLQPARMLWAPGRLVCQLLFYVLSVFTSSWAPVVSLCVPSAP
jgi:hypothetical protein